MSEPIEPNQTKLQPPKPEEPAPVEPKTPPPAEPAPGGGSRRPGFVQGYRARVDKIDEKRGLPLTLIFIVLFIGFGMWGLNAPAQAALINGIGAICVALGGIRGAVFYDRKDHDTKWDWGLVAVGGTVVASGSMAAALLVAAPHLAQ